eukprot:2923399-Ditylum_brightwellii.AAC.1
MANPLWKPQLKPVAVPTLQIHPTYQAIKAPVHKSVNAQPVVHEYSALRVPTYLDKQNKGKKEYQQTRVQTRRMKKAEENKYFSNIQRR